MYTQTTDTQKSVRNEPEEPKKDQEKAALLTPGPGIVSSRAVQRKHPPFKPSTHGFAMAFCYGSPGIEYDLHT